jgi:metal-responsive CopG/Arc/MetJ family transcriptional regulator
MKAIHIPDDLLRELKSSAAIDGRSMREAAAIAIRNYISATSARRNSKECEARLQSARAHV